MKCDGRTPRKPPPLVPKSAGTGSGPKTSASTLSRVRIEIGTASVQAMKLCNQGALIFKPLKALDMVLGGCVNGATRARARTLPGWRCARHSDSAPPSEWPTTTGRSSCSRSISAAMASACTSSAAEVQGRRTE